MKTYFDVRVPNPFLPQIASGHPWVIKEKSTWAASAESGSLNPLVLSGMENEATTFSSYLPCFSWEPHYSTTLGWQRGRLSFSLDGAGCMVIKKSITVCIVVAHYHRPHRPPSPCSCCSHVKPFVPNVYYDTCSSSASHYFSFSSLLEMEREIDMVICIVHIMPGFFRIRLLFFC